MDNKESQARKTAAELDQTKLASYEIEILEHHAKAEYELALEKLEESQLIVKKHYGSQSSEVSILPTNLQHPTFFHLNSTIT